MMTREDQATNGTDWTSAPIGDLIRHILDRHHAYLRTALPRLAELAAEAAQRGGGSGTASALQRTFLELKTELESHMWKEEMVLFPLVLGMDEARAAGRPIPPSHCGSVASPIRVMESEHDSANRALAEMRHITGGYPVSESAGEGPGKLYEGLAELEVDLLQHIRIENDILFPRATQLERRPV